MSFSAFVRTKVSRNKRRYKENGFDLDLSYITPRMMAMGFPSENVEGVYRNPFKEVFRFLEIKHKDHYKVYNLCSERGYDISKFHNRVECFPFDDHNAPPFELIFDFCKNVEAWLKEDPANIAVVHCKAGKGRTGLMICAYLLYSKEWKTADESLSFYGAMRTYNKKGVTIPSQIRYVRYVGEVMQNGGVVPEKKALMLSSIVFHTIPKIPWEDAKFQVSVYKTPVFTSKEKATKTGGKKKGKEKKEEEPEEETLIFNANVLVCGDIKVNFFHGSENKILHFWFNTSFIPENNVLELTKFEIDKVNKDKGHKIYKENFKITLHFQTLDANDSKIAKDVERLKAEEEKAKAYTIVSERREIKDGILNRAGKCTETQRKATEVAQALLTQVIELYILSAKQDIADIPSTKEFSTFEIATSELQKVALDKLTNEEKLCFWINVFNLLALHSNIIYPPASTIEGRFEVMSKAKYEISGHVLSLLEIEFAILRNKMTIPEYFAQNFPLIKKFDNNDARKIFALATAEPRINFALNPGTSSAPIVRIYHSNKIFEELEQATRSYLQENVDLISGSKEIFFPKILEWYYRDFAKTQEKMIRDLAVYLSTEQKSDLANLSVSFEAYDWNFHYSFKHFDLTENSSSTPTPTP